MIRTLLTIALPLLTPFLVCLIWRWAARRRVLAESEGREIGTIENLPWAWLISTGVALMVVFLTLTALFSGDDPFAEYHPPRFEDGKVVPGRVGN